jgi:hypothetical protein
MYGWKPVKNGQQRAVDGMDEWFVFDMRPAGVTKPPV